MGAKVLVLNSHQQLAATLRGWVWGFPRELVGKKGPHSLQVTGDSLIGFDVGDRVSRVHTFPMAHAPSILGVRGGGAKPPPHPSSSSPTS